MSNIKNGHYHGIPVYVDDSDLEFMIVEGKNWFYKLLVDFMVFWDVEIAMVDEFEIWIDVDENN